MTSGDVKTGVFGGILQLVENKLVTMRTKELIKKENC